jgi:VWFA-related protein
MFINTATANTSRTDRTRANKSFFLVFALILAMPFVAARTASAQDQNPSAQKQTQQARPPEAGGPQGDIGPIVIPKKTEPPPEPKPKPPQNPPGMGEYSITKTVNLVTIDATVLTKNGQFVPGLQKDNFKIYEDGVPQNVSNFRQSSDAPITAVLLVEFASNDYYGYFMRDAVNAAYAFTSMLKPQDWIAVVSYDMRPHLLTDFTQDKRAVMDALGQLRMPGFSETNMFDALYDTIDRLEGVKGRKYIVLIGTGLDTFSRLTFDKIQKKIKSTRDITIFTISTGEYLRIMAQARGSMGALTSLDFLQADNEMKTFASETGGRWYKPRFQAELPEDFRDIADSIRNQYLLSYYPTNPKQDGTFRKLKVQLQAPDGGPLTIKDQKGKVLKVQVVARDGYTAKHEVE